MSAPRAGAPRPTWPGMKFDREQNYNQGQCVTIGYQWGEGSMRQRLARGDAVLGREVVRGRKVEESSKGGYEESYRRRIGAVR